MMLMQSLSRIIRKAIKTSFQRYNEKLEYENMKNMMKSFTALITIVSIDAVPYITKNIWLSYVQSFGENYLNEFVSSDFCRTPYMVGLTFLFFFFFNICNYYL